ncbi:hypothetical protein KC330_g8631 [Hortaea werneckii]|nr:hypothetical protein KC330_g8631 [Hortaea werneckii]
MASYYPYNPSESRPRPRRNDSYAREDAYVKPTVGYDAKQRVGEGARLNHPDAQHDRRYNRRSYDSRYDYPAPTHDTGPSGRSHRSTAQRRHSWPPQPTVEDEAASLAKEAGTQKALKDIGKDEVRERGTIDQEPILQEIAEHGKPVERKPAGPSQKQKKSESTGIPTPPTSDEERSRPARRRPSKINTAVDDRVPDLSKRTSSPYAFTKPTKLPNDVSSSDRFLSPDFLTPPSGGDRRRQARFSTSSTPSSPRRDSARLSPSSKTGGDYFTAGYGPVESAILDDDGNLNDMSSRSNTYYPDTAGYPGKDRGASPKTSVVDFATAPPANVSPRRRNLDSRRNTDTCGTLPTLPKLRADKTRRASPLMTGSALSDLADDSAIYSAPGTPGPDTFPPRSRESSYFSSRGVSPASAVSARSSASYADPLPQNAKRYSAELPDRVSSDSSPKSNGSSRPPSPTSRPPGHSPRLPKTDVDWSDLMAENKKRREKPNQPTQPSRLATSMRQESVPDVHSFAFHQSAKRNNHPAESGANMPSGYAASERERLSRQGRPTLDAPFQEAKTVSRATSPKRGSEARATSFSTSSRPSLQSRHTMTSSTLPVEERSRFDNRQKSFNASPEVKRELSALLKKGLPECRRPNAMAGYDDWYTVIGAPMLSFCPDCVDSVFERTIYRPSIRRMPQLNYSTKIRCALGASAWIRLAWLLTLQQKRSDLTLLKDIADVEETSDPCPAGREAERSWYGLRDNEGFFARDFYVCYSDVRKIERLLPTLSGFFVRLPQRFSYEKHVCAMRADSNRFSAYLDALINTHEKSLASRKLADPMTFLDLVERKTRLRECQKDTLLSGGLWHYHPKLPALTVCEECFDAVIEPEAKRGSDIALRFYKAVQPVYGEGMGCSCQLYSPRMRKVFRRAVDERDFGYLARKAGERREAELRLQERYKDVMKRARRLSAQGGSGSEADEERRLQRELVRITEEWQNKWE